jgi:hypothetical protein
MWWNTLKTFENEYLRLFRFLSVWVILLTLSHTYTASVFNLVFLALLVFVGGAYIAFVYPKYYKFRFASINLKIDNSILLFLIELVVHFMLLAFVLRQYSNTYTLLSWQTMNSIALLCAYFLLHDVKSIYDLGNVDIRNIVMAFTVALLLYHMFIEK